MSSIEERATLYRLVERDNELEESKTQQCYSSEVYSDNMNDDEDVLLRAIHPPSRDNQAFGRVRILQEGIIPNTRLRCTSSTFG